MRVEADVSTPLQPGDRVRFHDREAPRPEPEQQRGVIHSIEVCWDGVELELDSVFVLWDDPKHRPDDVEVESYCFDELDQLVKEAGHAH